MSPFDFINTINSRDKKDLVKEEGEEVLKQYVPFIINRTLSYFPETVMAANEMNRLAHLDPLLQYHFLLSSVRPGKRFAKWAKKVENGDLDAVRKYYGYNYEKAISALSLLTEEQLTMIRRATEENDDGASNTGRN
jgi:hypothetical protein